MLFGWPFNERKLVFAYKIPFIFSLSHFRHFGVFLQKVVMSEIVFNTGKNIQDSREILEVWAKFWNQTVVLYELILGVKGSMDTLFLVGLSASC